MGLRTYQYIFAAFALAYLLLVIFTPIDSATVARYETSEITVRLIGLSISVIIVAIWLVGLYGVLRFKKYSMMIEKTKEGPGFTNVSNGLMVLVLSLPVLGVMNSVVRRIATIDPSYIPATAMVRNYLPIIFQLVAFSLIAKGAQQLLSTLKTQPESRRGDVGMLSLISFTAFFAWLVIARPFGGSVEENYYMDSWLVVATVIVPFMYAWSLAVVSMYKLFLYRRHVHGILYRQMLGTLIAGVATVTGVAIFIQLATSLSQTLQRLNFTPVLIIVYALIACCAVGFFLIARSARTLKKTEEV